jgi:hypothetical protein
VLTSNFLANGGGGLIELSKTLSHNDTGVQMLQSMIKYLKRSPTYTPDSETRVHKQ